MNPFRRGLVVTLLNGNCSDLLQRAGSTADLIRRSRETGAEAESSPARDCAECFVHPRSAVEASAGLDAIGRIENGGKFLRRVAVDRDAHNACAIGGQLWAVNRDAFDVA